MTGLIIGVVVCIFYWIICACLTMELYRKKGYDGGFWVGFFLGIIGLIYSAGLPDISKKENENDQKIIEKKIEKFKDLTKEQANAPYIFCKNCGFPIYEDENECANCGYKKKKMMRKKIRIKSNLFLFQFSW